MAGARSSRHAWRRVRLLRRARLAFRMLGRGHAAMVGVLGPCRRRRLRPGRLRVHLLHGLRRRVQLLRLARLPRELQRRDGERVARLGSNRHIRLRPRSGYVAAQRLPPQRLRAQGCTGLAVARSRRRVHPAGATVALGDEVRILTGRPVVVPLRDIGPDRHRAEDEARQHDQSLCAIQGPPPSASSPDAVDACVADRPVCQSVGDPDDNVFLFDSNPTNRRMQSGMCPKPTGIARPERPL